MIKKKQSLARETFHEGSDAPKAVRTLSNLEKQMATVSSTEEGLAVLKHIMDLTGYKRRALSINSENGEVNLVASALNEARRGLWIDIKRLIPIDKLVLIEQDTQTTKQEITNNG